MTFAAMTSGISGQIGNGIRQINAHGRVVASLITVASALVLSGCQTGDTSEDMIRVERAQGTEENIASLSSVIASNPSDPEGYNVRGSAYGRAGEFRRALSDFNQAIQLNPRFYQAYANRALV